MTKPMRNALLPIGTILFLVGVGSGIAHMQDEIKQKADKIELMEVETRFVAESLRTHAFKDELLNRLTRIDSSTSRTYNCLVDVLNNNKVRYCR